MRVAITGANGQLGTELVHTLTEHDVFALTRGECDIRDSASVRDTITEIRPAILINTAALTNVDQCEDRIQDAFEINACAVRSLACLCQELGCVLVHISTDYVFSGEKREPYGEDDVAGPISAYGVSKLAGEYFARGLCGAHFVVRTCGLYGSGGVASNRGNFVETMIRLARAGKRIRVVADQVLTPTYTRDLAEVVQRLIRTDAYGVYHVTNGGECSWYEFAKRIFDRLGMRPDFGPTTAVEFGARARRPGYSVLAHKKLVGLGFDEPQGWDEALDAYLESRGYA